MFIIIQKHSHDIKILNQISLTLSLPQVKPKPHQLAAIVYNQVTVIIRKQTACKKTNSSE